MDEENIGGGDAYDVGAHVEAFTLDDSGEFIAVEGGIDLTNGEMSEFVYPGEEE